MMSTDMTFTFIELMGKELYLATNFNDDVFDVGTHTRGTKLIFTKRRKGGKCGVEKIFQQEKSEFVKSYDSMNLHLIV